MLAQRWGQRNLNIVRLGKNILYWAGLSSQEIKAQQNNHMYSLSSHSPQFQQSAGATPLSDGDQKASKQ